jgi:L-ascorbate metabolism protein UlaG (beta-lactamase superfamily)
MSWIRHLLIVISLWILPTTARAAEIGCRPEMAQNSPRIMLASLGDKDIRISYIGHSSFLIETPRNVKAVTDYNDYVRGAVVPDIATMNKAHSTHYSRNPEAGITHLLPGWNPNGGKADHDITLLDMRVRNVSTNIRAWENARTEYDGNSIFVFEFNDLCVVHLGHLHHTLEPGHIRAIGRADIVLAPVDGGFTLDMDGMMEVLKTLSPRVVIPMHFFGQHTLEKFIRLGTENYVIDRRERPVAVFSRETLPEKPTMIVLPGR